METALIRGIKIVCNPHCYTEKFEQSRYPKSRKKRIRKKYRKLYGKSVRRTLAYQVGDTIHVHPDIFDELTILYGKGVGQPLGVINASNGFNLSEVVVDAFHK